MAAMGDHARVIKYRLEVAASRKVHDRLRLAHALRHLGDAYHDAGQDPLAEPCYAEALAIYRSEESRPPLDLANALRSVAVFRDAVGSAEAARPMWTEALEIYASADVQAGVAECGARLAIGALRDGDTRQTKRWLARSMQAAEASGDPETLRYVRHVRAQIEG
jgi:tetratricopeptide (TPR) repeat protein